MNKIFFSLTIIIIFEGCLNKKIEITPEYIINEYWNKKNDTYGGNSIQINKMKIKKDSFINISSELGNAKLLNKLEEDSLSRWVANIKIAEKSYKDKKIYFTKNNGFTWLDDIQNKRTMIFGKLEKRNWYKFSHLLSYPFDIYIYIDSTNRVYRFDHEFANY